MVDDTARERAIYQALKAAERPWDFTFGGAIFVPGAVLVCPVVR